MSPPPSLHALSDPGAGDLVVVWGPGGQRDTANRPEKGGPGVDPDVPLGSHPHWPRYLTRRYQFPTPLVSALGLRVGSNGGAGGCLHGWFLSFIFPALAGKQFTSISNSSPDHVRPVGWRPFDQYSTN